MRYFFLKTFRKRITAGVGVGIVCAFCMLSGPSVHAADDQPSLASGNDLMTFARAHCLFLYFEKMNYDTKDIRSISGGIVEMGSHSIDDYQRIALFMKDYQPDIKTKNHIDVDLIKCFCLENDEAFLKLIRSIE